MKNSPTEPPTGIGLQITLQPIWPVVASGLIILSPAWAIRPRLQNATKEAFAECETQNKTPANALDFTRLFRMNDIIFLTASAEGTGPDWRGGQK